MSNVEIMLGTTTGDFEWQDLAACRGIVSRLSEGDEYEPDKDDLFFDAYEANETVARTADEICMSCPVIKVCDEYATVNKLPGCWGGFYRNNVGKASGARNNHKSAADWAKLERLLGRKVR